MVELKKKLGARIQEIRKSKGITQERLAEMISMDTPNLSNIERGKKFMTADTLAKIASVLAVDVKELFDFAHIDSDDVLKQRIILNISDLTLQELKYVDKMITDLKFLRIN